MESSFSEYNTAVVVISRNSGEGSDQVRSTNDNGVERNGLTLTTDEYKLIDYASRHCSKVIIVINAANTMELGFLDPNDSNYNGGMYTDPYPAPPMISPASRPPSGQAAAALRAARPWPKFSRAK